MYTCTNCNGAGITEMAARYGGSSCKHCKGEGVRATKYFGVVPTARDYNGDPCDFIALATDTKGALVTLTDTYKNASAAVEAAFNLGYRDAA